MYITPARVASMGLGVDLSSFDIAAIRSMCVRSRATIDSVCAVPRLPKAYDFRGGVITKERHDWYIDPDERPHANRVYLNHEPVVSVEQLRIYSTNINYVQIDPAGVVINQSSGFIEISSLLLTQFGIFGAGIVPYIGLYQPIIETNYTYRYEYVVEDEIADQVDAQTFQTQNQFWLPTADVVVKVDGAVKVLTTDYTLDKIEGRVIFVLNQLADALVEVSYTYTLPPEISQASALLVADEVGKSRLRASGMSGLESLRVTQGGGASVEKSRPRLRSGQTVMSDLPPEVQSLLNDFVFVSAR